MVATKTITVTIDRDVVDRMCRRTITDREFNQVCEEVRILLNADMRMALTVVINDMHLVEATADEVEHDSVPQEADVCDRVPGRVERYTT